MLATILRRHLLQSNCNVQRVRPSGGGREQQIATSVASARPSSLGVLGGVARTLRFEWRTCPHEAGPSPCPGLAMATQTRDRRDIAVAAVPMRSRGLQQHPRPGVLERRGRAGAVAGKRRHNRGRQSSRTPATWRRVLLHVAGFSL